MNLSMKRQSTIWPIFDRIN